ncbi:MAG: hypothetical protein C3F06_11735 [Candidatus Methanoperedenaceae archaeon]|nr:MAG: hypothetical protein C3F06_11735 [Candidatus Methanoperedenaceae archaeon]
MVNSSPFENAYALIVGISKYKDPNISELRFTRADAEGIFQLFTDPNIAGIKPDKIKILLDEEATRFNIKNAISSWLFKNTDEESIVIIYFAGHGGVEEDRLGIEKDKLSKYLIPYDAVLEDLFSSAISNRDFNELLLSIKSKKLVIFMDTCYSGGVSEQKSRDVKITEDPYEKLGEGEGRIVIAASQPDQRSFEDSRIGHGVFTYDLLEALSGKADRDNDGYVTVLDAFRYLQEEVPKDAMRLAGGKQEPLMRGDITRDIVLSVNRDRRKLTILKKLYYDGKISGIMYERLRTIARTGQIQKEEDKDLEKLFNDFYSGHFSEETFLEGLNDYEPEEKNHSIEIKGKIFIQNTDTPLDDVNIILKIDTDIKTIVSDKNGSFFFNVSSQYMDHFIEYEMVKEGYETRRGNLKILDGKNEVLIEIKHILPDKKVSYSISSIPVYGKIALIILILMVIYIIYIMIPTSELSVSPEPLEFNISDLAMDEQASRSFSISNSGGGTLEWKAYADKSWLVLNPASGTDSGKIEIKINTTGLQPGDYSGIINIQSNGGKESGKISINILKPPPPLETINNSIGMKFVRIPAGEFDMGSPSNEPGRNYWEGPVHHVKISKDFYMGQYEVTQEQWFRIMRYNTSGISGDDLPAVMVSWEDVQRFIKNLNEMERTNKYRLPSEAEWEYAARSGMNSSYSFGSDTLKLGDYAWFINNSDSKSHAIGSKKPNSWELYDIHGNVYEWVNDNWYENYDDAPIDGSSWISTNVPSKVVRGGSWNSYPFQCRLAFRYYADKAAKENDLGFRVVKDL